MLDIEQCGIWGWYVQRPDRRLIPLEAALSVAMDERGDDSAGYYAYPEGTTKGILKRELGFFSEAFPARLFRGTTMLMAHSRDASIGKVNIENAHPFEIGDIVGCHNGAIYNYSDLNKKYGRKYDCDSAHVFAHISEDRSMKDIHGYGAISYVNKSDPEKIILTRWNGGELAIARIYLKDKTRLGIAWASTGRALAMALNVSGFMWQPVKFDDGDYQWIAPTSDGEGPNIFSDNKSMTFGYKGSAGEFHTFFSAGANYLDDKPKKGDAAKAKESENEYCLKCGCWDRPSMHKVTHVAPPAGYDSRNADYDKQHVKELINKFNPGEGEALNGKWVNGMLHIAMCDGEHLAGTSCTTHIAIGLSLSKNRDWEVINVKGENIILAVEKPRPPILKSAEAHSPDCPCGPCTRKRTESDPKADKEWGRCESCPQGRNRVRVELLTPFKDGTSEYLLCPPCLREWTDIAQESSPSEPSGDADNTLSSVIKDAMTTKHLTDFAD